MQIFGSDPFELDRIQSYDFRPKKGSVFIDAGKVIRAETSVTKGMFEKSC